jgi:hypothetical protein
LPSLKCSAEEEHKKCPPSFLSFISHIKKSGGWLRVKYVIFGGGMRLGQSLKLF